MTAATGKQFPVGLRYGSAFQLNTSALPQAPTTSAYDGLQFVGSKAFELTLPPPRSVVHLGEDRVLATDYLPSLDAATAVLRVSRYDMGLNAILMNVNSFLIGEQELMPWQTDQQGNEADVALFLYQQSLEGSTKVRNWRAFFLPSTRCVPTPGGMTDSPQDMVYNVAINPVSQHLWGTDLAVITEGVTELGVLEVHTEKRPFFTAWRANGAATNFTFSASKQAFSTAKIAAAWNNGTDVTGTITKATTGITFGVAPTDGNIICCLYELASTAT
jgi:hypothetical protein